MKTKDILSILAGMSAGLAASAAEPYEKPDGSYISLDGEVVTTEPDSFVLDYGQGLVTVEMDDWDWYGDAYGIIPDDDVVVYGYVDDDFYETTTIEASSVYVEDLNTYFHASGADEESTAMTATSLYDYDFKITGDVTAVEGREFTVDTGERKMSVDTWQLGYNPVDDQGYLQIEAGDRVSVFGDLDSDIFDEQELSAESVVKLEADERTGT